MNKPVLIGKESPEILIGVNPDDALDIAYAVGLEMSPLGRQILEAIKDVERLETVRKKLQEQD